MCRRAWKPFWSVLRSARSAVGEPSLRIADDGRALLRCCATLRALCRCGCCSGARWPRWTRFTAAQRRRQPRRCARVGKEARGCSYACGAPVGAGPRSRCEPPFCRPLRSLHRTDRRDARDIADTEPAALTHSSRRLPDCSDACVARRAAACRALHLRGRPSRQSASFAAEGVAGSTSFFLPLCSSHTVCYCAVRVVLAVSPCVVRTCGCSVCAVLLWWCTTGARCVVDCAIVRGGRPGSRWRGGARVVDGEGADGVQRWTADRGRAPAAGLDDITGPSRADEPLKRLCSRLGARARCRQLARPSDVRCRRASLALAAVIRARALALVHRRVQTAGGSSTDSG